MTIESHTVEYRGYRFDSRLEADWAATLTRAGVWWLYHPGAITLPDGRRYEPDFLLQNNVLLEVKGDHNERMDKLALLPSDRVVVGRAFANSRCASDKLWANWTSVKGIADSWALVLTADTGEWVFARQTDRVAWGARETLMSAKWSGCSRDAARHQHVGFWHSGGGRRVSV